MAERGSARPAKHHMAAGLKKVMNFGPKQNLTELLNKEADVFQDGIKHIKATAVLEEEEIPEFCKTPPVTYGLWAKVDTELQHLPDSGIISKVKWKEWNTLAVSEKELGCPYLWGFQILQYPLPRIEDVFALASVSSPNQSYC